jgi:hypothetical protein
VEQPRGPHPHGRGGHEGRRRADLLRVRPVHRGFWPPLRRGEDRRLGDPGVEREHRASDQDHGGQRFAKRGSPCPLSP